MSSLFGIIFICHRFTFKKIRSALAMQPWKNGVNKESNKGGERMETKRRAGFWQRFGQRCRGKALHMRLVRVPLAGPPRPQAVSPVLPPHLHLLPGQAGQPGHRLHLLHGEEGQVVEPPGEQGHRVAAVRTTGSPSVSLALGPERELG